METLQLRGVDCRMLDALSFRKKKTSQMISGAYVKIAKNAPSVFGRMYQIGGVVSAHTRHSPVYWANTRYAKELLAYLEAEKIDAIVCSHLFPAEALTHLRRRGLISARCYGVATDYTCIPFWEELDLDLHFIPHASLGEEFITKGIPKEKLCSTGIPVSRSFLTDCPKEEARAHLGLAQGKRVFLVMTGSMGFGDVLSLPRTLLEVGGDEVQVVILTGHNEKLYRRLKEEYGTFWGHQVLAVPYTKEVSLYMDASDVVMSKPGGLSSTEAAVKQVPLVHTAPIPGCETRNAAFFSQHQMSICAGSMKDAAQKAYRLAQDEEGQAQMRKAQGEWVNMQAADDICDIILRWNG